MAGAQAGGPRGACGCLSCISGIFQYETISCINCTDSRVVCFGYYCKYALATYPTAPGVLGFGNTPPASLVFPQVINTVAVSCTGPSELHVSWGLSGTRTQRGGHKGRPPGPLTPNKLSL